MAVRFENALIVQPEDNGTDWLVTGDFYYDTDVRLTPSIPAPLSVSLGVTGWRIWVERGFITDFASIPRFAWGIVGGPADGKYRKIAVVHDKLYRTKGLCTRKQADDVLLEGMKFSGCSWWERTVIYSAVRVGGSSSYKGGL